MRHNNSDIASLIACSGWAWLHAMHTTLWPGRPAPQPALFVQGHGSTSLRVPQIVHKWLPQNHQVEHHSCLQHCLHTSTPQVDTSPTPQEIAARIAANKARKAQRVFLTCPACGIGVVSPFNLWKHTASCCPDLFDPAAWQEVMAQLPGGPKAGYQPGFQPLELLLAAASDKEAKSREKVLHWTFRSGERDAQGQLIRHSVDEVAARLQLPSKRVSRLLGAAMRAVPLVADPDPIDILHECEHFLAVNKPPHVQTAPVHRYKGGSMVNRVLHHLGTTAPHVVHRLDMNTSGVLLFAKTSAVVSSVHKQFRQRKVKKLYTCVTLGTPAHASWEEHGLIGPHPDVTVARLVQHSSTVPVRSPSLSTARPHARSVLSSASGSESESDQEGGSLSSSDDQEWQEAHTSFLTLRTNPCASLVGATPGQVYIGPALSSGVSGCSLVAAAPHTGRTHQIRVHAAVTGTALLGDELYGLQGPWIGRQALHASRLSVTHPLTGEPLTFRAPLPADMLSLAQQLGLTGDGETDMEHVVDQAWEKLVTAQT